MDDLTLWVAGFSDENIHITLQEARKRALEFLSSKSLEWPPGKSELLLKQYRISTKETPREHDIITLTLHNTRISKVNAIKILGLRIQENSSNTEAVRAVEKSVNQTITLISRIIDRQHGFNEGNMTRLIEAYIA